MKTSIFGRTTELLSMATKVGAKSVFSSSVKTRVEQAKLIAQTLGQLKGAAMKAGQIISLEIADYFPPEAVAYLAQLQSNAESIPFEVMEKTLKSELGDRRHDFTKLSRTPIASASIGQVYVAELDQKKVAIKLQYPGISESIQSDMNVLKYLAVSLSTITGRQMDWTSVFQEITQTLFDEADYVREGKYLKKYAEQIAAHADLKNRILVPDWISSHSTSKVLTMSYVEGTPIREWIESSPSSEQAHKMAELLLNLFITEFYEWGVVQTDPNFANFLVQNDQLVLLDFGSTKEYSNEFRDDYVKFLQVLDTDDFAKVIQAAHDFGLLDPRESEESKKLFFEFMQQSVLPFMYRDGLFDFASQEYANQTSERGNKFVSSLKYTPPPSKLLFLHRRLGGTFALLKKMRVKLDVAPYWKKIIGGEYGFGHKTQ